MKLRSRFNDNGILDRLTAYTFTMSFLLQGTSCSSMFVYTKQKSNEFEFENDIWKKSRKYSQWLISEEVSWKSDDCII